MAHKVKCTVCGELFDRDKVQAVKTGARRYAHYTCKPDGEKVPMANPEDKDLTALKDYAKNLLGNDYNPARVSAQIKKFHTQYDYSYSGMLKALHWFYDIKKNPIEMAYNLAKRLHCVCVMKDACTVVADAKGNIHLNMFGNAGMATAGSGDVLSGIIASICCMYLNKRDVELEYQAAMGVMLHGLGGDKAAELKNMYSMTARDIIHGVELVLGEKED